MSGGGFSGPPGPRAGCFCRVGERIAAGAVGKWVSGVRGALVVNVSGVLPQMLSGVVHAASSAPGIEVVARQ